MSRIFAINLIFVVVTFAGCATEEDHIGDLKFVPHPKFLPFIQANNAIRENLLLVSAPPSLNDAVYARQVSLAFDIQVLAAADDQSYLTVELLCDQVSATYHRYTDYGVGFFTKVARKHYENQDQINEAIAVNVMHFQDELALDISFDIACRTLQFKKMDAFAPQIRDAAKQEVFRYHAQLGLMRLELVLSQAAKIQLDPIRSENHRRILDALLANIDSIAVGMSRMSRRETIYTIEKVLTGSNLSPDAKEKLNQVKQALARTECGPLCSIAP